MHWVRGGCSYLFLDADHERKFGEWLGTAVLKRQLALVRGAAGSATASAPDARRRGRGTLASMHDVFHAYLPSVEADGALGQMAPGEKPSQLFTLAKCRLGKRWWQHVLRERELAFSRAGHRPLSRGVSTHTTNPTLYMRLV
jgi:hypothetical protein